MIRQGSDKRPAPEPAWHGLYNVARHRTDGWNRLRDLTRRLRRLQPGDAEFTQAHKECLRAMQMLEPMEQYHAFPGINAIVQLRRLFDSGSYDILSAQCIRLVRFLTSNAYRRLDLTHAKVNDYADFLNASTVSEKIHQAVQTEARPYFEVLVVDELTPKEEMDLRAQFLALRRPTDQFMYSIVVVRSFEDALIASLVNFNIQSCVIRTNFPFEGRQGAEMLADVYGLLGQDPRSLSTALASERSILLGKALRRLRPELDLFLVTDAPLENIIKEMDRDFQRAFYPQEGYQDQHLSILKGIYERFEAPFFSALRRYASKPTGAFHALPISRAKSISKSHWIQEMEKFYGSNIFQAETSATTGGLDSLLQPHGPLKKAQELAARAFGADRTYFVTNGTSTANKIVLQGLIHPGDVVLLSHDCHKSHPYAVILAGALPVYMDAYALSEYSMYGGVPIATIKHHLLQLKRGGMLDRVKLILLTNITFDGVAYDPERVMEEILAIKPDVIFVWDEAWYAYGRFWPTLRERTAMESANRLRRRFRSETYRAQYADWRATYQPADESDADAWITHRQMADPDRTRVRVYVTQSTHKTLTALRQGSMIHVNDQDFDEHVRVSFDEAYMTHTSTSPNYQILASLDMGRRQVELEGYELVHRSIELAMTFREQVHADATLRRYFRVLGPGDMVPAKYRPSKLEYYYSPETGWSPLEKAWHSDEFVLDPTRVTIHVGRTGMDGDTFKKLLMDRFDIQINKTSRNTVLFMINIGVNRGAVAHLVKVLTRIAQEMDDKLASMSRVATEIHERRVRSLTEDLPPLPNFSRFHPVFVPNPPAVSNEGDMRMAFFLACNEEACRYVGLDAALGRRIAEGEEVVAASFVTPYPPGFPVLVPGQVITGDIVDYLLALDVKEIHGYEPGYGLRVFTAAALEGSAETTDRLPKPTRKRQGATAS